MTKLEKLPCPHCGKQKFGDSGVQQHIKAKHSNHLQLARRSDLPNRHYPLIPQVHMPSETDYGESTHIVRYVKNGA